MMRGWRGAVVAAMVAVGVVLVLDLMWFFQGSLEAFPPGEQVGKVRVVAGGVAVVLVFGGGVIEFELLDIKGFSSTRKST